MDWVLPVWNIWNIHFSKLLKIEIDSKMNLPSEVVVVAAVVVVLVKNGLGTQ